VGDRKEPNWAPGDPRYKGPPQVRPLPPPPPPPRRDGPAVPTCACEPAAGQQAPTFGTLRVELLGAARMRCPAGCGGRPAAAPGSAPTCPQCEAMADFALEVLAEMVRQRRVLPKWMMQ
jgi:hypothetical protein